MRVASKSKPVLIIEDDEAIRDCLRLALELNGFTAQTAANGIDGLDSLATMPRPGLILLDLMMPVMDGWQFLDALKEANDYSDVPVVAISAFRERGAKPAQVREFITKPVDLDALIEVTSRYCN
jgi:CheY-like chemotaxis protein